MGRPVAGSGWRRMGNDKAAVEPGAQQVGHRRTIGLYIERIGEPIRCGKRRGGWKERRSADDRPLARRIEQDDDWRRWLVQPAHAGDIGAESRKFGQHGVSRGVVPDIGEQADLMPGMTQRHSGIGAAAAEASGLEQSFKLGAAADGAIEPDHDVEVDAGNDLNFSHDGDSRKLFTTGRARRMIGGLDGSGQLPSTSERRVTKWEGWLSVFLYAFPIRRRSGGPFWLIAGPS